MRILIIEDEVNVVEFLQMGLTEAGYDVDSAFDGQIGYRMASSNTFDLIILDVKLPYMNGFDVCQKIREKNVNVPILMLTALGTTDDKLDGFSAGADDYLVKPFEFSELLARIKALSKRSTAGFMAGSTLKVADLELDLNKKYARRGDVIIELTAKEYNLLEFLMRNRGKVVSKAAIAEKVWDVTFDTGTNIVEVFINLLRKKIDRDFEPKLIQTRYGLGYTLDTR
ncbi:MAG: DNA-binding response regulator [Porphyromonadaceae bacterium]|nr:MAG: DNA-binding response regulator [Porphyromonadaceae bacterium]